MSEHINSTTPFSSGGHRWQWAERPTHDKRVGAVGTYGEIRTLLRRGAMTGRVTGLLKAASNAALTALEEAIEALADSGAAYSAEDDQGHTMPQLAVHEYRRVGNRLYGPGVVWQRYEVTVVNLLGVWS